MIKRRRLKMLTRHLEYQQRQKKEQEDNVIYKIIRCPMSDVLPTIMLITGECKQSALIIC
jgi:hypothetical protein